MIESLETKITKLEQLLANHTNFVAFSGGVDSTVLAAVSSRVADSTIAVTINSGFIPPEEIKDSRKLATIIGVKHEIISFNEQDFPDIISNPRDRCYYCKKEIIRAIKNLVKNWMIQNKKDGDETIRIIDGSNLSDLGDYRPGRQALLEEGIFSPFIEAKFTKDDIRALARKLNLPNAEQPSQACLASRIQHFIPLDRDRLGRVLKAENFVRQKLDLSVLRVRDHGDMARIEVGRDELYKIMNTSILELVDTELKKLGFKIVTIDTSGYKTGSMSR